MGFYYFIGLIQLIIENYKSMCREKVNIPIEKPYIFLQGNGAKATIIKWSDHDEIDQSATFVSSADNFVAKDISFQVKKLGICLIPVFKICFLF